MRPLPVWVSLLSFVNVVLAQPALTEPPDFPQAQSGPQAENREEGCFLLAHGTIFPGDVDWIAVRLPHASARTVIDVDFPTGAGASALLAMVANGASGFNIGDNNNTRDALCGLNGSSSPVGNLRDSVVDLRATTFNAVVNFAVTGAADTSFVGLHNESFTYEVWVYALPTPCMTDPNCDDAVACTWDQCDVPSGDCLNTPMDDFCNDNFFCNGVERCDAILGCRGNSAPSCDDGVDCTDDYCDFGVDQCVNEPWDGYCENEFFCDGEEFCDPLTGCQAGTPTDCDDGSACTLDTCDEEWWECVHTFADDACNDGQFCNGLEQCDAAGGCVAGSAPCPNSMCRESDDLCVDCLTDSDCGDGVYCNGVEHCNALGQCENAAFPCGASMCRESDDRCVECLANDDCNDDQFCNGLEFCTPDGNCEPGAVACGSGLCREADDRCVECLTDADCDDGVFCNGGETCNASGTCIEAQNPCLGSTCRETDQQCVECLTNTDCDDNAFCNGMESCDVDGACVAGTDPCGNDFCLEGEQRCVECLTDSDCADDLYCNGVERCQATGVCVPGVAPCPTVQSCNESADQCVSGEFTVDIKPGVCPARVLTTAQGFLPVALVGFDVRQINPNSVRMVRADGVGKFVDAMNGNGQAPRFRDESGPMQSCGCPDVGPDGSEDLIVSFKLDKMVKDLRLDNLRSGTVVELKLTGKMRDGTPFSATDCVVIQSPGRNGTAAAQ